MENKKQFCYSSEKARRSLVALHMTTTFIVLKIWNNQLKQPPFLLFFPFIIRLLDFCDFLLLQYHSKT